MISPKNCDTICVGRCIDKIDEIHKLEKREMYEIEIKAHVDDCESVRKKLATFATFGSKIEKRDTYYRFFFSDGKNLSGKNYVSARIRTENITEKDGCHRKEILLTYKKKETRQGADGKETEVNEENECTLSDAEPLEKLLLDTGFAVYLKKEKYAESWFAETEAGTAHIELCEVPPLGFFLEIEIISPTDDSQTVEKARSQLYSLIEKCGIDKSKIERRYYSELLRDWRV